MAVAQSLVAVLLFGRKSGFQIVLKVACDALVQVHALVAHHVVALAGIDVEVGLGAGSNARVEETVGMLRHHSRIVETDDDLQATLEVLGLVDKA